jgi:general secretion pathway protein C
MGPWLIKALNICLLGASCFLVANVVTEIGAEALEPSAVQTSRDRPEADDSASRVSPSVILARNLFGARLHGDRQVSEDFKDAEQELTESKLPLRLLGTAASNSEARSRASIENEKTKKSVVVKVGHRFKEYKRVRVTAIERGRVILDNAGKAEELRLHEDQPPAKAARQPRSSRQARRASPRARETANDRLKDLNGTDGQGLSRLLSSARIVPFYDNGKMLGMKVDAIKPDSLYQKLGLMNGDVITEVNGIVIDRLEATSAIFDEFGTADKISVTASRGDQTVKFNELADNLVTESN